MTDLSKINNVEHFRSTAEEMRVAAECMSDEKCRSMAMKIAADYDRMAEWAEKRIANGNGNGKTE
jgi:hypothetical protein